MQLIDWLEKEAKHSERYDLEEYDSLKSLLERFVRVYMGTGPLPTEDIEFAIEYSDIESIEALREADEE